MVNDRKGTRERERREKGREPALSVPPSVLAATLKSSNHLLNRVKDVRQKLKIAKFRSKITERSS